jgi:hypothetical protein
VEIGVVDLVVPWRVVRLVLLVLGVYGALWMLGFIGAFSVRPHVVTADRLWLRFAHLREVAVPLDLVDTVRTARHSGYRRSLQVEDGVLAMAVSDNTTVSVRLREPWSTMLKPGTAEQTVTEVRFHADDPRAAVAALTAAVGDRESTPR